MGFTSRLPETVTYLPCRDYAYRGYLAYADDIERLGPMPGMDITAAEIARAVGAARQMAMTFIEPGDQESGTAGAADS